MSKADALPIWLRPEPGDRKPRFTREKIAQAALAIADEAGFDAVSMREVAQRVGAGTMTLYHYVRTKEDLIALMDDALMAEVLVPDAELPEGVRARLAAIAKRTRDVYRRHPWALIALQGARPGPNGMRHFEQCLAALADTSLDTAGKLELLGMIDDFVFGHALRAGEARQRHGAESGRAAEGYVEFAKRQLATGEFPQTAALLGGLDPQAAAQRMAAFTGDQQRFERGLTALLDAAEAKLRTKPRPRKRSSRRLR